MQDYRPRGPRSNAHKNLEGRHLAEVTRMAGSNWEQGGGIPKGVPARVAMMMLRAALAAGEPAGAAGDKGVAG